MRAYFRVFDVDSVVTEAERYFIAILNDLYIFVGVVPPCLPPASEEGNHGGLPLQELH